MRRCGFFFGEDRPLRILLTTIALTACANLATAADLGGSLKDEQIAIASANWSGVYVGAHAGRASGKWDGVLGYEGNPDYENYSDPRQTLDADGWLAGGQIGFNRQIGSIVLGIEADISRPDFSDSETFINDLGWGPGALAKKLDFKLDSFGTLRGRLGYSFGRFMPYVTGGLAWGKTDADLTVSYPLAPDFGPVGEVSTASASETHFGWTVGAGGELALDNGWSIKAEWLHVDLGEQSYRFKGEAWDGSPFDTDSFKSDLKFDVFRLGVNYKFGG